MGDFFSHFFALFIINIKFKIMKNTRIPIKEYNLKEILKDIKEKVDIPSTSFKNKKYISITESFTNATNLVGLESGSVHGFAGKSDSGKSTAVAHIMINAIKMGVIPVYIDLEQKIKWSRLRKMGLEFTIVKTDINTGESIQEGEEGFDEFDNYEDENGESRMVDYSYEGNFYYVTPNMLIRKYQTNENFGIASTEDVASFIYDLHEVQKKTNVNFAFIIDSMPHLLPKAYLKSAISKDGSYVDSDQLTIDNRQKTQQNNNILGHIIQKVIKRSLYSDVSFYNWLFLIYNVHEKQTMNISTIKVLGGEKAKYFLDTLFYFGGKGGEAGRTISATKTTDGIKKNYNVGKVVKIDVEKGHIDTNNRQKVSTSLPTNGTLLITPHGFTGNSKNDINDYKKKYPEEFVGVEFEDENIDEINLEHNGKEKEEKS